MTVVQFEKLRELHTLIYIYVNPRVPTNISHVPYGQISRTGKIGQAVCPFDL